MKKSGTAQVMSGFITTAMIMTGCGSETSSSNLQLNSEWSSSDAESVEPEVLSLSDSSGCGEEVDLQHLQETYPGLDLTKVEDYIETNCIAYDETEFVEYLDDISINGEDTTYDSTYSSIPLAMFLFAGTAAGYSSIKGKSGTSNKIGSSAKPTSPRSGSDSDFGSSSGMKSGFGSGSSSTGS
ncbi:hypothetical protein [Brevibacillus daliensis]|uniref:hypothetical protein n=1 Tax=Brevibacillus daliensis TaxID=2892995 RepID=UPI001E4D5FBB|nr:hypothetical protein [Brevibacillus daliensis]